MQLIQTGKPNSAELHSIGKGPTTGTWRWGERLHILAGLLHATQRWRGMIWAPRACAVLVCRYFRALQEKKISTLSLRSAVANGSFQDVDLTLNLNCGKYYQFWKPNSDPCHIHTGSDHRASILANIPTAISQRITDILSDRQAFDVAAPAYGSALKTSGAWLPRETLLHGRDRGRPER